MSELWRTSPPAAGSQPMWMSSAPAAQPAPPANVAPPPMLTSAMDPNPVLRAILGVDAPTPGMPADPLAADTRNLRGRNAGPPVRQPSMGMPPMGAEVPPDLSTAGGDFEAGQLMLGMVPGGLNVLSGANKSSLDTSMPQPGQNPLVGGPGLMPPDVAAGVPGDGDFARMRAQMADEGTRQILDALPGIITRQAEIGTIPVNPAAQEVMNAEGFMDAVSAAARGLGDDPYGLLRTFILRSLPASAPGIGGALAGSAMAGPGGAAAGAGIGEFLTEGGISAADGVMQALKEAGVDPTNRAAVEAFVQANPEAMRGVAMDALQRAGIISATGAVSGGVSGLAARNIARGGRTGRQLAGDAVAGVGIEPVMEGAGEALAGGSGADVVAEALGGAGQGAVQLGGQTIVEVIRQALSAPAQPQSATPAPVEAPGAPDAPAAPVAAPAASPQPVRPVASQVDQAAAPVATRAIPAEPARPAPPQPDFRPASNEPMLPSNEPRVPSPEEEAEAQRIERAAAKIPTAQVTSWVATLPSDRRAASSAARPATGIDPDGEIGRELKANGVTPQRFPRLFQKGGRRDLDNIPYSQLPEGFDQILKADEAGYVDRQDLIDAIIAEANKTPRLTSEQSELRRQAETVARRYQPDYDAPTLPEEPAPVSVGRYVVSDPNTDLAPPAERAAEVSRVVDEMLANEYPDFRLDPRERMQIEDNLFYRGGDADEAFNWWLIQNSEYVDGSPQETYAPLPFDVEDAPLFAGEDPASGGGRAGEARPQPGADQAREDGAGGAGRTEPGGGVQGPDDARPGPGAARTGTAEGGDGLDPNITRRITEVGMPAANASDKDKVAWQIAVGLIRNRDGNLEHYFNGWNPLTPEQAKFLSDNGLTVPQQAAAPARSGTAEGGRVDLTRDGPQLVIPGAEQITDKQRAERRMEQPKRGGDAPPPDGGLFSPKGPELFDGRRNDSIAEDAGLDEGDASVSGGREIDKAAVRQAMEQTRGAAQEARDRIARGRKLSKKFNLTRFMNFLDSYDAVARKINESIKSAALGRLIEALRTQAGGKVSRSGGTLEERYTKMRNVMTVQFGRAMKALEGKGSKRRVFKALMRGRMLGAVNEARQTADKARVVQALRTGDAQALNEAEREVFREVRTLLRAIHTQMTDAGVNLGDVGDNYFPRMYDADEVASNREAFIEAATALYEQIFDENPRQSAIEFADSIILGERVEIMGGNKGGTTPFASRVFTKDADDLLGEFMVNDLERVMLDYINRAARRTAIAREFGDQFSEFDARYGDEMRAEGVPSDVVKYMEAYIQDTLGISPNPRALRQNITGTVQTITTLSLLEHATITSIPELVTPAIRAGMPIEALFTALVGLRDLIYKVIPKMPMAKQLQALEELGEDLGVVVTNSYQSLQIARFADNDAIGRTNAKIMAGFFRGMFLEQFTQWTRLQSLRVGVQFLRRLGKAYNGNSALVSRDYAEFMFRELGIQDADMQAVADLMQGLDGIPRITDLAGRAGELVGEALYRFADQSIQRPNASTKPQWAQRGRQLGEFGPLIFQLQSFGYAFGKNVVGRALRLGGKSLDSIRHGRLGDAMIYSAPLLMMLAILPVIQYGLGELRDEWDKEMTGKEKDYTDAALVERAISRAGLLGAVDPYLQMVTGTRYGRSTSQAAAGPALGMIFDMADDMSKLLTRNADTNTQERRVAKAAYQLTVEPAINALAGIAAPNIIGFGIMNAARYGQDAFVDAVAGPEERSRSKKPVEGIYDWIAD